MKIKNIIFDFDGTLFDSKPEIINTIKKAFEINCIDYDLSAVENLHIGPPLKNILLKLLGDDEKQLDKLIKSFRFIYDNSEFNKTLPYPGCIDTLKELHAKDINLFIATNKPKLCTEKIIKKYDLQRYFKGITNIDSLEKRRLSKYEMIELLIDKFDMIKSEVLMVGDTISDIKAAHKADVKSSMAAYGYESPDKQGEAKHLFVIYKFCDILNFIKKRV